MICERCGKEISDNAAICPSCGTITLSAGAAMPPITTYGQFPVGEYPDPQPTPTYDQGYIAREGFTPPGQPIYAPPPQQNPGYGPLNNPPPVYQAGPINAVNNPASPPTKSSNALPVEIILSLFGIYGIGWRMAGKTTVSTILLICSLAYWVLAFNFIIVTWGFGLLCLGPLSIVLIIVNAILLNNAINQSTSQFTTLQAQQQPPPQMPRRQWPPQ